MIAAWLTVAEAWLIALDRTGEPECFAHHESAMRQVESILNLAQSRSDAGYPFGDLLADALAKRSVW
jgi:hypothetical protein